MTAIAANEADRSRPRALELRALTRLRAFAAFHVVCFHTLGELGGPWTASLPDTLLRFVSHGQSSVSFFFVLSGFILAYNYVDEAGQLRGSLRRFLGARFARIYPLYALSFLVDAPRVISFFLGSASSLGIAAAKTITAALAYLTLLQSWHPRLTNAWNAPGWSLSAEAFFYASFPILVWASRGGRSLRFAFGAFFGWGVLIASYWALRTFELDFENPAVMTFWRSAPLLRIPEFMIGVAAARFLPRWKRVVGRRSGLALASLVAILIVAMSSADWGAPNVLLDNALMAPLFALLVLGLACAAKDNESRRRDVFLVLGEASYAVYILHQPLQWWFRGGAETLGLGTPSPALFFAYLTLVTGICTVAFFAVEQPARRAILKRIERAPNRSEEKQALPVANAINS